MFTFEEFVQRNKWRFAASMSLIPHEYCKRTPRNSQDFSALVRFIRARGYKKRFGGKVYTYFDYNGWQYWTMGNPIVDTTILNRAPILAYSVEYSHIYANEEFGKSQEKSIKTFRQVKESLLVNAGYQVLVMIDDYSCSGDKYDYAKLKKDVKDFSRRKNY